MTAIEYFDDEQSSVGLTRDEIRTVAKRQFFASAAAALVLLSGAAFVALSPSALSVAQAPQKRIVAVQQPRYVDPLDQGVASAQQVELP